ncbi:MAG: PaaI family thioesterase [Bacteroidota bacterium]|nr:PaaI family thioesterase [Bacteroidota bacterium]MDP3144632.1 PaaI family thioesterase [Bacteroidota bacterium]MDP3556571.1 PaaI family thioesterase [Bacteroidota bacterium]
MAKQENNLIEKYIENNFFGKLIGMDFKIISEGVVDYFLTINKNHLATPNAAHGGVISSLIDGALGVAGLSSVYKENKVVSTIEYKLNFLAPAFLNDKLLAKAKVEQKGNRILIISCDVFCLNRENKLLAKSLGTFNAYDASKAGY